MCTLQHCLCDIVQRQFAAFQIKWWSTAGLTQSNWKLAKSMYICLCSYKIYSNKMLKPLKHHHQLLFPRSVDMHSQKQFIDEKTYQRVISCESVTCEFDHCPAAWGDLAEGPLSGEINETTGNGHQRKWGTCVSQATLILIRHKKKCNFCNFSRQSY